MKTLILGNLPVDCINRTLKTEIEAGVVIISRAAQKHAESRHPTDYPVLLPHLATVILNPLYIGDDLRNPGKIELIGKVQNYENFVLVSVVLQRNDSGQYNVASFYPVARTKIEERRQKGYLRVAITQ
jgi:phage-Barnase-EndoU-ColicinE5/D-RelE like nuclease3